ncbi:MAG: DinB family protein [Promethearchaeota archaeon]
MNVTELIKSLAASTRDWREYALRNLQEEGCTDLSYRPKSGMSALGWVLAHQGAAYDFALNMLLKGDSPKYPDLFHKYRGDSEDPGDWSGHSLQEINDYYDLAEKDFIEWVEQRSNEDLNSVLEGSGIPQFFNGMRVIDVIAFTFTHLNHHNGHLSAIKGDWCKQQNK